MIKRIVLVAIKALILVGVMYAAIFYRYLGWFLVIVWAIGFGLALLVTWPEWKETSDRMVMLPFACVAYLSFVLAVHGLFVGQKSEHTFPMTWENKGPNNQHKEAEIVLKFVSYPGHYQGDFSNELASYLVSSSEKEIPVTFEVTRDFGCLRGFTI